MYRTTGNFFQGQPPSPQPKFLLNKFLETYLISHFYDKNNFCKFNLDKNKKKSIRVFILLINCQIFLEEKNCLERKTDLTLSIFNLKLS